MLRSPWIWLAVVALAFVLYTGWKQTQLAPRVPVSSGGGIAADGLLDGISLTVAKLGNLFRQIGGSAAPTVTTTASLMGGGTGGAGNL
jgi:hypothetical protein